MGTEIKVGQIWYDGLLFRQVSSIEKDGVHYFFSRTIEEIESRKHPMTFCGLEVFLKNNNLHKEANEQFKFQVGDVVRVAYLNGEHEILPYGDKSFPLAIKYGEYCNILTDDGRQGLFQELPVLTLVRRPKKEMTFQRIKDEGIKNMTSFDGSIREIIGFSSDGKMIAYSNDRGSSFWSEEEIKDWKVAE